ncbi:MAG: phage holin family protein [Chloroflexi bacterium]|nr:phage holin family protein [Chloroflexota bacterium]
MIAALCEPERRRARGRVRGAVTGGEAMARGVGYRYGQSDPWAPSTLVARFVINLAGVFVAEQVVPGFTISDWQSLVAGTAILAIVNILLRPLATFFSFCLIVLTFGLFVLVINTALLGATAWVAGQFDLGFHLDGFWSAFFSALIISLVSLVASTFVRGRGRRI